MRNLVPLLLSSLFLSLTANAQDFPPTIDLHQKVQQLMDGVRVDALTVDATGNVYIAGLTGSAPAGAVQIGPQGSADILVLKLNSTADQVLYQVTIGGTQDDTVKAIRADASGNLYLIGSTTSDDFPFSATVVPETSNPIGGMVLKLNPAGTALTYALELGARIQPLAFDVDSTGAVYIGGQAPARDLPKTPGVLMPSPLMDVDQSVYLGFVAKVNTAGSALDLATYFGPQQDWVEGVAVRPNGIVTLGAGTMAVLNPGLSQVISQSDVGIKPGTLHFDGTGNIYVTGSSQTTAGFVVRKYAPTGGAALLDKELAKLSTTSLPRAAVTPAGRIYVFGVPTEPSFETLNATQPCLANIAPPGGSAGVRDPSLDGGLFNNTGSDNAPGDQAFLILDTDGTLLHSTFISTAISNAAVAPSNGSIYAAGVQTIWGTPHTTWRGIVRFNPNLIPETKVSPSCLVHGATFAVVPFSPGAIMTVFGSHLGPATGAQFTLDANNKVGTSLGGVSMTVGGTPAVLLYAQDRQINFIVPWLTPSDGSVAPVCITYDGATNCISVATTPLTPGVFMYGNGSAAVNQDYSINQPSSPAPRGSIVSVYMTGTGQITGTPVDGGVSGAPLQYVVADVSAIYSPSAGGCTLFSCSDFPNKMDVPVQFVGAAPGYVQGVTQINLMIPADMPPGDNQVFILSFQLPEMKDPVIAQARLSVK